MSGRFPGGEMHILPFRVPAGKVSWSSYSTSTSVTKPCSIMPFHCSKSKTSTICKRCEQNVASYGKPTRWDKMQFNEIVETKPKYFAAASFANCRLPLWAANVNGAAATTRSTHSYLWHFNFIFVCKFVIPCSVDLSQKWHSILISSKVLNPKIEDLLFLLWNKLLSVCVKILFKSKFFINKCCLWVWSYCWWRCCVPSIRSCLLSRLLQDPGIGLHQSAAKNVNFDSRVKLRVKTYTGRLKKGGFGIFL